MSVELASVMRIVQAAMERNVRSLTPSPPALRKALKRSQRSIGAMVGGACPGLPTERGAVVVTLASPGRIAILKYHGEGIVEDAIDGTTIEVPAVSPEPVDDVEVVGKLGHQFAIEAMRGLMAQAGGDAQRLLRGWIIVTGIVAWDGEELALRHAASLVEASPLH